MKQPSDHDHPAGEGRRSHERLRRHYDVERELADRLRRAASRTERAAIYATMYDTLFAEVPDHPRLTLQESPAEIEHRNQRKLRLVEKFLGPGRSVLEIGSGDCTFAHEMARRARVVFGVEISARSAIARGGPENFHLVLYDGFEFPFAARAFDLVFSDQLIEHLHPDDAALHFRSIARVLSPGGAYVFRTPHRFTGPHDVSRYFTSGDAQGFHLKEWTYRELDTALRASGYARVGAVWNARGVSVRLPIGVVAALEAVLSGWSRGLRRRAARLPFPSIVVVARTAR